MSNTYVKKYDVGEIKLDLPYANYIHELPLLSFGDVQHTINLSLVFNYARKEAGDNSFNIANGYKLNLQKRIVIINNMPAQFEEANGRLINLTNTSGVYTFDDESQRILRPTPSGYGYVIEYPDFSEETFNDEGYITGVYSKYDKIHSLITYVYEDENENENGKLISICYKNKTINLSYNTLNELSSINYAGKSITLTYIGHHLTVTHYSGVDYNYSITSDCFSIYSANTGEGSSDPCSRRWMCTKNTNSITIEKLLAGETIDRMEYDVLSFDGDKITLLDVTNKNGVKMRTHFKGNKLLYSYETGLNNNGFVNDEYCGNVSVQNVFNNKSGIYTNGVKKPGDGTQMEMHETNTKIGWEASLSSSDEYDGIYIISGWINLNKENNSDTIEMIIGEDIEDTEGFKYYYHLPKAPVGEWVYFAIGVPWTLNNICAYIKKSEADVETKDFIITFQQSFVNNITCTDEFVYEEDALILEDANGNSIKSLSLARDCQFYNGNTLISGTVTLNDILQYKINQRYGTYKNTFFYKENGYKEAITDAETIYVEYIENEIPHTIAIESVAVGKLRYANGKISITKANFYPDDNNNYNFISKSYIDDVCYKEDVYNDKLDIVSSTVEDVTVHYDYASESSGLVYKKTITPKGVDKLATTRPDVMVTQYNYDSGLTKIDSVIDEFGNTTQYTTDTVWGIVTSVTLPDGTVITDDYDCDRCALLSRVFSNETDPRKTIYSYSGGYLTGLTHTNTTDSIDYSFTYGKDTYGKDKLIINKGSNTIEEHEHTDTTLDSYYPSKASNLHSILSDFDKYGRITKIDGLVEYVYDAKPNDSTSIDSVPQRANASALLTSSKDLTNNQESKYLYNPQDQLIKKQIYNSTGSLINEEMFTYDAIGRLTEDVCIYDTTNSKSVKTVILYEKEANDPLADNRANRYSCYLDGAASPIAQTGCDFDDFNRITSKFCSINGKEFTKNITYDKTRPRLLLEMLNGRPLSTIDYEYDVMGRISSINDIDYTYDAYGQLIEENNNTLDKTIEYEYNTSTGNLDSVTNNGTVTTFGYTDVAHPDRLTSYNGKAITYNDNGGVASYDGWDYTWTKGKLSRIKKNMGNSSRAIIGPSFAPSKTYTFDYNGLGQRISQNYSYFFLGDSIIPVQQGEITAYNKSFSYDHLGRLIAENIDKTFHGVGTESSKIVYLYDESGIIGMQYTNSTTATTNTYYFLRNLQGDVVAIYDTTGNKVVEYSYDAWGNCTIESATTNYPLAHANPIRYRGYYYDEATKLYYLNARYYNPQWRRFISPDDTAYLDPETPNGLNLYAYCNNDPVNYSDPSGHSWESFWNGVGDWFSDNWVKLAIGAGVVIAGAIVTAATCGTGLGFFAAFGGALLTSAKAVAISTAISAGIGLTVGGITTGSWEGALDGMLDGIADGFMWGGIFAGGAQILSGAFKAYAQIANHYNKLAAVKKSPFFSPDRLKSATEIAKIAKKGQSFYDYGGTIVRFGRFAHIDASTKSLLHLATLGFNHIPIGTIAAGFIGGF